jgi:hypothetical protein
VARLPSRRSGLMALRMGVHHPIPHQAIRLPVCETLNFRASEPLLVLRASGVQIRYSFRVEVNATFSGAFHRHRGLFSAHPLSTVLQYKFIMLFTFIDLLHKVHSHHTFTFSSCFSMVIPILGLITNLGETGCYNSLPLRSSVL